MNPLRVIQNSRPDEIILAYWREVICIEDDAELLNPEYMEATQ